MPNPNELDELLVALDDNLPKAEADGEYEFWKAADVLEGIRAGVQPFGKILGPEETEEFRAMLSGLINLFLRRHFLDMYAPAQIIAINKLIFPRRFGVPHSAIESMVNKYESGHIARGMALRNLMHEMADLIVLADPAAEDPTKSTVSISTVADQKHRLYPLVRQHCRRGTTLKSLAIRVYLDLIHEGNGAGNIDETSLRRDLRRLSKWEQADESHAQKMKEYFTAPEQYHWKVRIPLRLYSESFSPQTPVAAAHEEALNRLREDEKGRED